MKFRIVHTTRYSYPQPVSYCYNLAHLKPRAFQRQSCLNTTLRVEPLPAVMEERQDFFGNHLHYFALQQPHVELNITAVSELQVDPQAGLFDAGTSSPWQAVRAQLPADDPEIALYRLESPFTPLTDELQHYATPSFPDHRPLLDAVHDLMQRIHMDFIYDPHFSTIATPLAEVLRHRRGVCQDFAHLAIACLRAMGLAARYVSGYLETQPPPGQPRMVGADASHAWFSVYVPQLGWIDFDPTNNQVPMEGHIVTAWGRDYGDIAPLKGVIFGGGDSHTLDVAVDVERID